MYQFNNPENSVETSCKKPACLRAGLVLVMVCLLGACTGAGKPPVQYYLLDPVESAVINEGMFAGNTIEIMDLHIPRYLERTHIATRREQNRVYYSSTNQWAENLRKNLIRTMAGNLAVLLSTNDISTPLNRSLSQPDYRIRIHIEQFERQPEGMVRLLARWQVADSVKDTSHVATYSSELHSPGRFTADDYAGIVQAMQVLYGQLSEQVAETILDAMRDNWS